MVGKAVRKCSIALIAGMAIGAMVFCGSSIGCHMLSGGRVYAAEKGTDSRGYAEKPEHYIPLHIPLDDYTVGLGESLWGISESMLGDGRRWEEIAVLNGLSAPYPLHPGQNLSMPDKIFYMQKPASQRGEGYYLTDEGAFRFQDPGVGELGPCSLDSRLSIFMEEDSSARVLWGIEDNEMGEDAWAKNWDSVCRSMEQTARTVFKDNLKDIFFEKYKLEDGKEVYNICCSFWDEKGEGWTVSAAYRFGKKNLVEFIGIGPARHGPDMGKLTKHPLSPQQSWGERSEQ